MWFLRVFVHIIGQTVNQLLTHMSSLSLSLSFSLSLHSSLTISLPILFLPLSQKILQWIQLTSALHDITHKRQYYFHDFFPSLKIGINLSPCYCSNILRLRNWVKDVQILHYLSGLHIIPSSPLLPSTVFLSRLER